MGDAIYNVQKNQAAAQAADPLITDGQKLMPSVTRVFSKNRDLLIYLQAYQRNAIDDGADGGVRELLSGRR